MESESQRNESLSVSELREERGLSAGLSSVLQRGGVPPWPYGCSCVWHPGISERVCNTPAQASSRLQKQAQCKDSPGTRVQAPDWVVVLSH